MLYKLLYRTYLGDTDGKPGRPYHIHKAYIAISCVDNEDSVAVVSSDEGLRAVLGQLPLLSLKEAVSLTSVEGLCGS